MTSPLHWLPGRRGALLTAAGLLATISGAALAGVVYLGPDGEPLPFADDEEVLEFLREAEVVAREDVPVGTTRPKRVTLEREGIRADAVFRDHHEIKRVGTWDLVDSYLSEVAAYELSRLLGLDAVPPTTLRKVKRRGSLQLWIEGAMTDADRRRRHLEPPDPGRFQRQLENMWMFDNLIANVDRNPGNILIGHDWKVWFIDHTRSFAGQHELKYPDKVRGCDRVLWERLQRLTDHEIEDRLRPYARLYLDELLRRRHVLMEEFASRLARGEVRLYEEDGP